MEKSNQDRPNSTTAKPPVQVPIEALTQQALLGLIEEFILREGTDYGASEVSLETKIAQVKMQLEKSEVIVVYDPESESATLLTDTQLKKILGKIKS